MNKFQRWILKNTANIFGFIGIVLTLYFGAFYVPSWLKEAQEQKIINAQRNLESSLKELIYFDSICEYSEIVTLIEAKEIELNQDYPFSINAVLTKVQESFMQDRFLPLEKRKELISELENLKKKLPGLPIIGYMSASRKRNILDILVEWLPILISIIIVSIGIYSFYFKFKIDMEKDEEIENQVIEAENVISDNSYYESQIKSVIHNFLGVQITDPNNLGRIGFDIEFEHEGTRYFVEIKYLTKSKIGLKSFQKFIEHQKGLEGNFWLVYNTDLTEMVKNRIKEINKLTSSYRKIVTIRAENEYQFKRELEKLIPKT